jgi:hypothetical protein
MVEKSPLKDGKFMVFCCFLAVLCRFGHEKRLEYTQNGHQLNLDYQSSIILGTSSITDFNLSSVGLEMVELPLLEDGITKLFCGLKLPISVWLRFPLAFGGVSRSVRDYAIGMRAYLGGCRPHIIRFCPLPGTRSTRNRPGCSDTAFRAQLIGHVICLVCVDCPHHTHIHTIRTSTPYARPHHTHVHTIRTSTPSHAFPSSPLLQRHPSNSASLRFTTRYHQHQTHSIVRKMTDESTPRRLDIAPLDADTTSSALRPPTSPRPASSPGAERETESHLC